MLVEHFSNGAIDPSAAAQSPEYGDPIFVANSKLDDGIQTSVAAHPSGLVLEFHKTQNRAERTLYYRVGRTRYGNSVNWGPSHFTGTWGFWPTVTISKEGYVILSYSTGNMQIKNGSDLYYRVGKIDPYGDQNQSIQWLTSDKWLDAGFHSSLAMNDNGVIVGVHEAGRGGDGIYYWVGRLVTPEAGHNYDIVWDSGQWGIRYDTGINPHIAINNHNDVVSVHQVYNESLLHYRRGKISGGQIAFGESKRYDNNAEKPAVALRDDGLVIHLSISSEVDLSSRTGALSKSNPEEIVWHNPNVISTAGSANYPAVAAAGSYAIETHEQGGRAEERQFPSVAR